MKHTIRNTEILLLAALMVIGLAVSVNAKSPSISYNAIVAYKLTGTSSDSNVAVQDYVIMPDSITLYVYDDGGDQTTVKEIPISQGTYMSLIDTLNSMNFMDKANVYNSQHAFAGTTDIKVADDGSSNVVEVGYYPTISAVPQDIIDLRTMLDGIVSGTGTSMQLAIISSAAADMMEDQPTPQLSYNSIVVFRSDSGFINTPIRERTILVYPGLMSYSEYDANGHLIYRNQGSVDSITYKDLIDTLNANGVLLLQNQYRGNPDVGTSFLSVEDGNTYKSVSVGMSPQAQHVPPELANIQSALQQEMRMVTGMTG
jgi:hypothetical protein